MALRNSKQKKWFFIIYLNSKSGEVLIALKQNLDVTKVMRFLTVSLDKHAILGLKEEEQN
jgi:hypothetical protein